MSWTPQPNSGTHPKLNIATATDVLLGKKESGQRVLIVGGGLIGCKTALWLAQQDKEVTIVEMLSELISAGIPSHMQIGL